MHFLSHIRHVQQKMLELLKFAQRAIIMCAFVNTVKAETLHHYLFSAGVHKLSTVQNRSAQLCVDSIDISKCVSSPLPLLYNDMLTCNNRLYNHLNRSSVANQYRGVRWFETRSLISPSLATIDKNILKNTWADSCAPIDCNIESRSLLCYCESTDEIEALILPYTNAPTVPGLISSEHNAYEQFRNESGVNWGDYCGTIDMNPCSNICSNSPYGDTFHRIKCSYDYENGGHVIKEIVLRNANLTDIPEMALSKFSHFTLLDLTNSEEISSYNQIKNYSIECLNIPRCLMNDVSCHLPRNVCTPDTGESRVINREIGVVEGIGITFGSIAGLACLLYCCCLMIGPCLARITGADEHKKLRRKESIRSWRTTSISSVSSNWSAIREKMGEIKVKWVEKFDDYKERLGSSKPKDDSNVTTLREDRVGDEIFVTKYNRKLGIHEIYRKKDEKNTFDYSNDDYILPIVVAQRDYVDFNENVAPSSPVRKNAQKRKNVTFILDNHPGDV